jgi:antitoxin component of MazEF toxin-antitoxin module
MMQKIIKIGRSSLGVIIPADFIHAVGIRHGDSVKVHADPSLGKVELSFSGVMQLSLPTKSK